MYNFLRHERLKKLGSSVLVDLFVTVIFTYFIDTLQLTECYTVHAVWLSRLGFYPTINQCERIRGMCVHEYFGVLESC